MLIDNALNAPYVSKINLILVVITINHHATQVASLLLFKHAYNIKIYIYDF
jgi:hypothetical protein